ncbi:MAG: MotA/TolQ/ExbB proton channel family protein [Pseudomonadales bacterium]|jgi:chemotaxis protein MotA|nr:MotA/TolQ/ExbB proton channel family protein [Pseudomonadales bacterium]
MDLATLIGLAGALGAIGASIFIGGSASSFINVPSIIVVFAGTLAVTLMKYPLAHTLGAFKVAGRAFVVRSDSPAELIRQSVELAETARREGLLGLEQVEVRNPFLAKGIQLAVDGNEPELVQRMLRREIDLSIAREREGNSVFKSIGDIAPAMGMIGTLIGLVQMMSNMDDPASIGPAMAIALLTTLYGAVLANAMALPIADKLELRSIEESRNKELIIESIKAIQDGLNPRVVEDLLVVFSPDGKLAAEDKDAA